MGLSKRSGLIENHLFYPCQGLDDRGVLPRELALERAYADAVHLLQKVHLEEPQWQVLQELFLLRLLAELGYIASAPSWQGLISAPTLAEAKDAYDPSVGAALRKAIERASEVSHL